MEISSWLIWEWQCDHCVIMYPIISDISGHSSFQTSYMDIYYPLIWAFNFVLCKPDNARVDGMSTALLCVVCDRLVWDTEFNQPVRAALHQQTWLDRDPQTTAVWPSVCWVVLDIYLCHILSVDGLPAW